MIAIIKKIIPIALAALITVGLSACNVENLGVIDVDLPAYEIPYTTPIGDHPDVEGLKVDGAVDDLAWAGKEWNSHKITTEKGEINACAKTVISQKGIAIAFAVTDSVIWIRKYNQENTRVIFTLSGNVLGGKQITVTVGPEGVYPSTEGVNVRTSYDGDLSSGQVSAFSVEAFISWEHLKIDDAPQSFTVGVQYLHKISKVAPIMTETWSITATK